MREQPNAFAHLCRRLAEELDSRPPEDFGRWLDVEREHGFRRLLPGKRQGFSRRGLEPDFARRLFRWRAWRAFTEAARCYTAALTVAGVALKEQNDQVGLSAEEQCLFWQAHGAQAELAGIPFSFFPRGVAQMLLRAQLDRWNRAPGGEAWAGTGLSRLLGVFAVVTDERRRVDREKKARKRHPTVGLHGNEER